MRTTNHNALLFPHARIVALPAIPFTALPRQRASLAGLDLKRIRYVAPVVVVPPQVMDGTGGAVGQSESRLWTALSMAFMAALPLLAYLATA